MAEALGHDTAYFLTRFKERYKENRTNGLVIHSMDALADNDKKMIDKLVEMFCFYDALAMDEI